MNIHPGILMLAGICLWFGFIIWSAHYFDPDKCSKCGGPMEMHIDGNLHCDNCGHKLKL